MEHSMEQVDLITHTADIVSAHVSKNKLTADEVPGLVQKVYGALSELGKEAQEQAPDKVPVVSVRASVKPDHLVCMESGKKPKTLKRHLQTAHGMTPAEYRSDYGLPDSYPMVAPNYSERRCDLAKTLGLGRRASAA
jgi:predicted transcriptional regulator